MTLYDHTEEMLPLSQETRMQYANHALIANLNADTTISEENLVEHCKYAGEQAKRMLDEALQYMPKPSFIIVATVGGNSCFWALQQLFENILTKFVISLHNNRSIEEYSYAKLYTTLIELNALIDELERKREKRKGAMGLSNIDILLFDTQRLSLFSTPQQQVKKATDKLGTAAQALHKFCEREKETEEVVIMMTACGTLPCNILKQFFQNCNKLLESFYQAGLINQEEFEKVTAAINELLTINVGYVEHGKRNQTMTTYL